MMVRKPDRLFRRSSWPPGTWLLPDLGEYMYSRHGTQFSWHDPTQALALLHSIHLTKGGIG
jgi:hypothetical protein